LLIEADKSHVTDKRPIEQTRTTAKCYILPAQEEADGYSG
jgi:hypothetical protein